MTLLEKLKKSEADLRDAYACELELMDIESSLNSEEFSHSVSLYPEKEQEGVYEYLYERKAKLKRTLEQSNK